jgi:hypothetical protein
MAVLTYTVPWPRYVLFRGETVAPAREHGKAFHTDPLELKRSGLLAVTFDCKIMLWSMTKAAAKRVYSVDG